MAVNKKKFTGINRLIEIFGHIKAKLDALSARIKQPDWNQTDSTADDYIKNKPTIPSGGVTGVKGNSESTYRSGNVNLTAANIGALPDGTVPVNKGGTGATTAVNAILNLFGSDSKYRMKYVSSGESIGEITSPKSGLAIWQAYNESAGIILTGDGVYIFAPPDEDALIFINEDENSKGWSIDGEGTLKDSNGNEIYIRSGGTVSFANRANLLQYSHGNEINFLGDNNNGVYFNYRDADTDAASAVSNMNYFFCNYSADHWGTTINAGRFAGSADRLGGYSPDENGNGNTIVKRTADGYIKTNYFNASCGDESAYFSDSNYIIYALSDGYFRKATVSRLKDIILGWTLRTTRTSLSEPVGVELYGYREVKFVITFTTAPAFITSQVYSVDDIASSPYTNLIISFPSAYSSNTSLRIGVNMELILENRKGAGYTYIDGYYIDMCADGTWYSNNPPDNFKLKIYTR